jgi:hypothetical protein
MRILLDECVPRRFGRELPEHEVRTAPEMGWASFANGDLLRAASGKFDVLITTDQRLRYQRDVSRFSIAVVVLVAKRNKLESLVPLVPELRKFLREVKPGEVRQVGI